MTKLEKLFFTVEKVSLYPSCIKDHNKLCFIDETISETEVAASDKANKVDKKAKAGFRRMESKLVCIIGSELVS